MLAWGQVPIPIWVDLRIAMMEEMPMEEIVSAEVALLKWGLPLWRQKLRDRFGVDYSKTPAEDFTTGLITYRNPSNGGDVPQCRPALEFGGIRGFFTTKPFLEAESRIQRPARMPAFPATTLAWWASMPR